MKRVIFKDRSIWRNEKEFEQQTERFYADETFLSPINYNEFAAAYARLIERRIITNFSAELGPDALHTFVARVGRESRGDGCVNRLWVIFTTDNTCPSRIDFATIHKRLKRGRSQVGKVFEVLKPYGFLYGALVKEDAYLDNSLNLRSVSLMDLETKSGLKRNSVIPFNWGVAACLNEVRSGVGIDSVTLEKKISYGKTSDVFDLFFPGCDITQESFPKLIFPDGSVFNLIDFSYSV